MPRYDGPIVDAHHHFWQPELGRQPWLRPDASIPFRYGDYSSLKSSYLPPDLLRDAAGLDIVGTVSMETEWELDDPVGEMDHMQTVYEQYGLPTAAVAHAVLDDPAVDSVLEQLAARPLVRAVRDKPGQADAPADAAAHPSRLVDPRWRAGYALLARYGLGFELQTAWWHLAEAAGLAAEHPETTIVVNHAGLPADRSPEAIAGWTSALRTMAEPPNVSIKISGIGQPGVAWTADANRVVVDTVAEVFGPDRIMFASNFPVDGLTGSYRQIYDGFLDLASDWSDTEQRAAFFGNAVRVYRLPAGSFAGAGGENGSTAS